MTAITSFLRALVRGYQLLVRPLLPASCRYHPSCSQYALEALAQHGALRGCWLIARRLLRCHPWSAGGYDPVPAPCGGGRPCRSALHEAAAPSRDGLAH